MNETAYDELISAALDGEPVNVEALRVALGTAEGQRSLAAFVLLRAATAADEVSGAGQAEATVVVDRPSATSPRRWTLRLAAASIAALAVAGSFWLGTTWAPQAAPATAMSTSAASPPPEQEPPPTPARRLEYVPGVDWQTGS